MQKYGAYDLCVKFLNWWWGCWRKKEKMYLEKRGFNVGGGKLRDDGLLDGLDISIYNRACWINFQLKVEYGVLLGYADWIRIGIYARGFPFVVINITVVCCYVQHDLDFVHWSLGCQSNIYFRERANTRFKKENY